MTDAVTSDQAAMFRDDAAILLRCPRCHTHPLKMEDNARFQCTGCDASFTCDVNRGFGGLLADATVGAEKQDIQAWWGDLYKQLYQAHEDELDPESLVAHLAQLEDLFRVREHMAAVEMPLDALDGVKVLEIGSGGGGHSALFRHHGADIVSVDITPERVVGTAHKLQLLDNGRGRAYQADGENLPFRDNTFDIVYSNGVLHHSVNTDRCMEEVYRVLKPGGRAIIMVYARHSASFWFNIVPRGVISGAIFRLPEAEWVGQVTEGKPKFGTTKNPYTRVYSAREVRLLFNRFTVRSLRKSSFQFDNFAIPRLTQIRDVVLRALGYRRHSGGELVYGTPTVPETALELLLGRYIGFAWNVIGEKPAE